MINSPYEMTQRELRKRDETLGRRRRAKWLTIFAVFELAQLALGLWALYR
jgi:hypothetical protein